MSLVRAAGSISVLTLASRVLGLVRDVMMVHVLGTSWAYGTFILAWLVPNMLRRLFGEGALSAAFVPVYTRALRRGSPEQARGVLASVTGALIAGLGVASAVVVAVVVIAPDDLLWAREPRSAPLLRDLLVILFPYVVPICLVAIYSGALNALGSFAPGAASPIVLNVVWIGGLLAAAELGIDDEAGLCRLLALCLLAGGAVQLGLIVWPLRRRDGLARPRWPRADDGSREVFRRLAPTIVGMSLVQLNLLVDQGLAYYLLGEGESSHVYLANRLLLFPHALIALPLATAVFPTLAAYASSDDLRAMRRSLGRASALTLFLAIPATFGLFVVQAPFLEAALVHGEYTAEDAAMTGWTTIALVAGLPGLGLAQLYARALYALGDTRSPARIAGWLVLINLALNLVFILVLGLGVAGLTAATSCCTYVNALALRQRLAQLAPSSEPLPWRSALRTLAASVVMMLAVDALIGLAAPQSRLGIAVYAILIPSAAGALVYALLQIVLGSPEVRELRRVRELFTRRRR